jgi:hypothetical protein
MERKIHM